MNMMSLAQFPAVAAAVVVVAAAAAAAANSTYMNERICRYRRACSAATLTEFYLT